MSTSIVDSNPTDAQLVTASTAGDRDAFGVIVRRYQGIVTGLIYNRCRGNLARSEELAQETFIAAWHSLGSLKNADQLSAWLCGIARNVVNASIRQQQGSKIATVDGDFADRLSSQADDPSAQAIGHEREETLWKTLERIPMSYREPMILFYRQQQSAAEVGEALGLSESNVRKRLQRGREMLRDQMASLVEEFLSDTSPNANFSIAVMAALPSAGTFGATKTIGGSTFLGANGAKLATASFWLGPVIAMFAGLFGIVQGVRAAQSGREKSFVIRHGVTIFSLVFLFMGLHFGLSQFRSQMSGDTFVLLTAIMWIVLALVLAGYMRYSGRQHQRIHAEQGTVTEPRPWPKAHIYLGPALGLICGMSWIFVLAARAGDWLTFLLLAVGCVASYFWTTQALLRGGPTAAKHVMLKFMSAVFVMFALVVNFRLRDWMISGAGRVFGFPSGDAVPEFPLFTMNLLLFAIGLMMILPIAFMNQGPIRKTPVKP